MLFYIRIDCIIFHWYWYLYLGVAALFCGPYPNWIYRSSSLARLRKVMERVQIGRSYLPLFIKHFDIQRVVRRMYILIYQISIHWSWYLSSGVIENCLWAVSKPDIQICFPRRLEEGRGEDASRSFVFYMCMEEGDLLEGGCRSGLEENKKWNSKDGMCRVQH